MAQRLSAFRAYHGIGSVHATDAKEPIMLTLRITQTAEGNDQYRVETALDENGRRSGLATSRFLFAFTDQDREGIRWYLEDYLEYPLDPAPKIATRIERRIADIGTELFSAVFDSSPTAQRLWARLQPSLNDTRLEIITGIREATSIPWELLRDPLTGTPLALDARAFVRSQTVPARPPRPVDKSPLDAGESRIRILLIICRPRGRDDVPFRSVASRILRSLSRDARNIVQLDVLRPPTFEQLGKTLRAAKRSGQPYHVVHFDGHGIYANIPEPDQLAAFLKSLGVLTLGKPRPGEHGYVLFENPQARENTELIDGDRLGKLIVETGVPVLVLNACQSAFAQAPEAPTSAGQSTQDQVRAFGSLAQEAMNAGVAGVVAMRYVLHVETAKRFVADLYDGLLRGETLGGAVTFARKQLADDPQREIGYKPIVLQDWPVPIGYEAGPIALFPPVNHGAAAAPRRITVDAPARVSLEGVAPPPDVGFFGRDETLLALDRAFDTQSIVLLNGYAGSGKTTTAAEFARWYVQTGGVQGPVLFTTFEQYRPLPRVLDVVGHVFEHMLEQNHVNWLTLDNAARIEMTLLILRQVPVLWIWDNVEPVAGWGGLPSAWSVIEQKELADFLRAARETGSKFLLTSRREERAWLGDLPRRVKLPPMPMQERVQLARALADRLGRRMTEVEDWQPLLNYTAGNPLTLTVVVGQALRDGLRTREEIEAFVTRLRAGEAVFDDEASEGRSRSLGASLAYGFASAFTEAERKRLALLHLFQGFVYVGTLEAMGDPEIGNLPEVHGISREAGMALLARASEIGMLTSHGGGLYSIQPALPWFFRCLFEQHYGATPRRRPTDEVAHYLTSAARLYQEAPDLLPPNAANDVAITHNQLGIIYLDAGDVERALIHFREAARSHDSAGNLHAAAQTRYNVAVALVSTARLTDALDYAEAALQTFSTFGDRAGDQLEMTQRLVEEIRQLMSHRQSGAPASLGVSTRHIHPVRMSPKRRDLSGCDPPPHAVGKKDLNDVNAWMAWNP
ncbi:MAG: CHAT domain-containing protein [Acidobacteriota bacterium]